MVVGMDPQRNTYMTPNMMSMGWRKVDDMIPIHYMNLHLGRCFYLGKT